MSAAYIRSKHRGRVLLAMLLVFSMTICVGSAVATDNRVDRRAAEMPLPDPYLDPTWPDDQPGVALGDHYEAGDSDNVEDVPLEDEAGDAQRALEALTGDAPAAPAAAAAPAAPGLPAAAAAAPDEDGLPDDDMPAAGEEDDAQPDDGDRDPVEW